MSSRNPGMDPHAPADSLPVAATKKTRSNGTTLARQRRALEMYLAGSNLATIAEQLGWKDRASASRAVQAAMAQQEQLTPAQLEQARQLELTRLDKIWQAHYLNAMRGDARATDLLLKITDKRMRLLGLDQPVQAQVVVTSALDAEIQELVGKLSKFDDRPEEAHDDAPAD